MNWRKILCAWLFTFLISPAILSAANEKVFAEKIVPPAPPREFRAVWLATVGNIDWPSKPGLPVAQQKAELISLLNRAAQLNFNAVLFQVRPMGDAFYASPFEPWSEYLTGRQGRPPKPFYDPLAFAVAEAHKRGLQLHAWFNPFRAGRPDAKSPPAPNHVTRTHPEWVWHYGNETWVDPGEPQVRARALAVMLDVVKRYDVDGVVLDDYFYPYPVKNAAGQELDFPDDATWKKYGVATGMSRQDWRRDNVNRFVHQLSQEIKAAKPWVQFGISPFGIWRPGHPPQIKGFDSYEKICCDSRLWLERGWVDYLSPQLYWPINQRAQSFPVLLDWWRSQNPLNRHVWPSLADYTFAKKSSVLEIPHQIEVTRRRSDPGEVHFATRSVLDNPVLCGLVRAQYAQPALVPRSPWIHAAPPPKPSLIVDTWKETTRVQWGKKPGPLVLWWLLQTRAHGAWKTEIYPADQTDAYLDNSRADAISVRAVDRLGNLSEPAIWRK